MGDEKEKNDLRIEDRRYFDKEGNPIQSEEAPASVEPAGATQHQHKETSNHPQPKIDFPSLIFIYVQTALIHLGELEDPVQQKSVENFDAARQMIDILELLQEKTRGNITAQEDQYLEKALFDLRLLYVQKAKKS